MKPLVTVIIVIAVGAVAFYGGMRYQSSRLQNAGFAGNGGFVGRGTGGNGSRFGGAGGANRATGFRPVNGEVLSADDSSVTVKLPDGSSKIVLYTDKTVINKASEATKTDVKAGDKVAVFGTANPDGSVTAQNIQLNPITFERNRPTPAQ